MNSNSLTASPRARYRTFLWSSLRSAERSSMRTMSENPDRMAECANGEGVPEKRIGCTVMSPDSILSRTYLALLTSMSSSSTSR